MASVWPRPPAPAPVGGDGTPLPPVPGQSSSFEREGDKFYLAPEVLQGKYGKAADIFRYVLRFSVRGRCAYVGPVILEKDGCCTERWH